MNTKKPLVICTTLLIENSPQALPLGAACIASAIKKDARTKDKFSVELRIASETRTSTPVRILRDERTYESPFLSGLFPCGEGSGYAGGIVSSAMDGEKACRAAAERW